MASQIAVRGCEQKAVYVYYPDSDTWIIDGAVTALSSDYQVPPPIDKGRGKRGEKSRRSERPRSRRQDCESGSVAVPVEPVACPDPVPVVPAPVE